MKFLKIGLLSLYMLAWAVSAAWAGPVDNSIYAELLGKYVKDGRVDYAGFKREEAKLDAYLEILKSIDPGKLSRDERMAYYINVYNAFTIKLILREYPDLESIKDIGGIFSSPWKIKFININGQEYHLDNIEHDILRPEFKDPRVHFAVNCASIGCPELINVPYEGATLDARLSANTAAHINDPAKTRLEGEKLYVNKIFKWFSEDFEEEGVPVFVKKFAEGDLKTRLDALDNDDIRLKYLDYDWSLNDLR